MTTSHPPHTELHVVVHAPGHVEAKPFRFDAATTVADAAAQAAAAFAYAPGGSPSFAAGERVLDRSHTLEQEHVHNGDKLELVDVGGGV